jgi:hypothetical protein
MCLRFNFHGGAQHPAASIICQHFRQRAQFKLKTMPMLMPPLADRQCHFQFHLPG